MRIIPAIDIIGGKCVRLSMGDYSTSKVYNENPLEVARRFEDNGIKYLHLVDLDGAKSKHVVNHKILKTITDNTSLQVDFGGGIKSITDLRLAFESGARQVTIGSIAANNPGLFLEWLAEYGSEKIILGADCKNRKVSTNGWLESLEKDVTDFIGEYQAKGILFVICTDIAKDGMLQGPSTDLYKEILEKSSINLIASGGITTIKDIEELIETGCEGAIIGKAIFEGKLTLKELSRLC
jgi:phosphoribosylformimino-5-aminoimidazole carboxamide ribotide isomerase